MLTKENVYMIMQSKNGPLYIGVMELLKKRILQGHYTKKLPSIRLLAQEYNVSESTIKKLLDQLKRQNYLYSYQGKGVYVNENYALDNLNKLAFFLPEDKKDNPFYMKIIHFLLDLLHLDNSRGLLFMDTVEQVKLESDSIGLLILIEPNKVEVVNELANCIIPERIVMLNSALNDQISYVISDNYSAGYSAMQYLYGLNHQNIAIAATTYGKPVDYSVFEKRLEGARAFFKERNLKLPFVVEVEHSPSGGKKAVQHILNCGKFTAVYCLTDIIATGALEYCKENNISVPEELSILGFGNIPEAAHQTPPLTTYEENIQEIINALSKICEAVFSGAELPKREIKIPPFLIKRKSTIKKASVGDENKQLISVF
jgi:DNA-binding LacI/PurR family transcriptional regulator